jgi:glycine/D-amino acid oxidase-like deaminating enzyme
MPAAFSVAAGVINPVTGRWMTKSWQFDQLRPEAERTYREIETRLGIQIYHPIPQVRFCQNADDVNRAGRRLRNPRYRNVLGDFHEAGQAAPEFNDPHGSFDIHHAAYVDLPQLVPMLRAHFAKDGLYHDQVFEHSKLKHPTESGNWRYDSIRADRVIFCEGAAHAHNPWFREVLLQPAKGETLRCHSPTLHLPQKLYHHTKWILSYPDGSFRIGASYDEDDLGLHPTAVKKKSLLEAARTALKAPHNIDVREHLAGVRPSSRDSRPILGPHPNHPGLFLFNGLGSKGASTAPLMAQYLVAHMLENRPLDAEVDLARFLA